MPCFNRALCSRTSLSNQYSDHVRMKSNRMHDITELLRLVLILPDTDYTPPALASDRLTVMHSKPRSLCERTCLFIPHQFPPATAPPRHLWITSSQVARCPRCGNFEKLPPTRHTAVPAPF